MFCRQIHEVESDEVWIMDTYLAMNITFLL